MADEQVLMQLGMMENEINQTAEQIKLIEQNILELRKLNIGLEELEKSDEKNILANIGKGIYISAEIKSKVLKMEAGNGILVNKNINDAGKIIKEQVEILENEKSKLIERVQEIRSEIDSFVEDIKEKKKEILKR